MLVAIALYWGSFAMLPRSTWGPLLSRQAHVWDAIALVAILVFSVIAYRLCFRPFAQQSVEGSIDWSSPSGAWPS